MLKTGLMKMNKINHILMIMKRLIYFLITVLLFLFACGSENSEEQDNKGDSSIVEIESTETQNQLLKSAENGLLMINK